MKKLITIIAVALLAFPAMTFATGANWGRIIGSMAVGINSSAVGSETSLTLNTAFAYGATGTADGVLFDSPTSQTNGNLTLYAYCTAVTGSPTNSVALLYNVASGGTSNDKPEARPAMATSTNTDASSCGTAKWLTYSFTGVTLNPGSTYWVFVVNTTATPASNNFALRKRGSFNYFIPGVFGYQMFAAVETSDGFTTASAGGTYMAPMVLKFDDGTLMGQPFVTSAAAHATNQNDRGFRIQFNNDVKTSCAFFIDGTSGSIGSFAIYQGATTVFATTTTDSLHQNRNHYICYPQKTLSAGLDYDFVMKVNTPTALQSSTGTLGNSPPADITSMNPHYYQVDGTTPGSYTVTTTQAPVGNVIIDDNPLTSSGGTGNGTAGIIINGRVQIQ